MTDLAHAVDVAHVASRRSRSSPSTTPSSGRPSSTRSRSAPISRSTRRPSSWAGRATSSAASRSRTTRSSCSSCAGLRALFGNILQADEAWILDSRLATVTLRMNRQSKNAQRIAERLAAHPRVGACTTRRCSTDPEQQRIRDAQCDFPGSVFSIEVEGGKRGAFEFLRRLKIARNAVSLGGIETLACHPKTTTHSELSDEELARGRHQRDALVRISIGTEHWRDLIDEFEGALGRELVVTGRDAQGGSVFHFAGTLRARRARWGATSCGRRKDGIAVPDAADPQAPAQIGYFPKDGETAWRDRQRKPGPDARAAVGASAMSLPDEIRAHFDPNDPEMHTTDTIGLRVHPRVRADLGARTAAAGNR